MYAGKKFREDIFGPTVSAQKFVTKIVILSQLVVHYHWVTFIPKSKLPVLVMERLQSNLHHYLVGFPGSTQILPRPSQVAILADVASGLIYLHSQDLLFIKTSQPKLFFSHILARSKSATLAIHVLFTQLLLFKRWQLVLELWRIHPQKSLVVL